MYHIKVKKQSLLYDISASDHHFFPQNGFALVEYEGFLVAKEACSQGICISVYFEHYKIFEVIPKLDHHMNLIKSPLTEDRHLFMHFCNVFNVLPFSYFYEDRFPGRKSDGEIPIHLNPFSGKSFWRYHVDGKYRVIDRCVIDDIYHQFSREKDYDICVIYHNPDHDKDVLETEMAAVLNCENPINDILEEKWNSGLIKYLIIYEPDSYKVNGQHYDGCWEEFVINYYSTDVSRFDKTKSAK